MIEVGKWGYSSKVDIVWKVLGTGDLRVPAFFCEYLVRKLPPADLEQWCLLLAKGRGGRCRFGLETDVPDNNAAPVVRVEFSTTRKLGLRRW